MSYVLDTNAVIALLSGKPAFLTRVRAHAPSQFALPAIAVAELYFGAFKSARQAFNLARVDALQFAVLDFDKEDARQAGEIRAALAAMGQPIGPFDVLIAAQARARGLTLITHNVGEFVRVPGLLVEDWES